MIYIYSRLRFGWVNIIDTNLRFCVGGILSFKCVLIEFAITNLILNLWVFFFKFTKVFCSKNTGVKYHISLNPSFEIQHLEFWVGQNFR